MKYTVSAFAAIVLLSISCSEGPAAPQKRPPELLSAAPGDTTVSIGDTVHIALEALDADGAVIGYTYTVGDSVGFVDSTGIANIVFADSGAFRVAFTAVDNDSLVSAEDVTCSVTVILDPPMLDSLARTDTGIVRTGDTVDVRAHATDQYGNVVMYVWSRGGVADTTAEARYRFVASVAGGDTLVVSALDEDGQKSGAAAMVVEVVEPAAVVAAPRDTVIAAGRELALVCGAVGTDASFAWLRNDSLLEEETDSILLIDTVTMADSAAAYVCIVSNVAGSDTAAAATVTALRPAHITADPTDAIISPNYDARFTTSASGSNIVYQWQYEGADIEGADSSILVFELVSDSLDGAAYRCIVANAASADTSDYARILFTDKPVIIRQPVNDTVELDSSAKFSVAATSPGEFTYRWQRNGAPIDSNASDSVYTIEAATGDDHGALFRCILTNDFGSDTTAEVGLYVLAAPSITANPVDTGVYPGDTASLMASAEGLGLRYQWLEDGDPIAGATDSGLILTDLALDDDSSVYSCVVANDFGADTSAGALLTVYGIMHVKADAAEGGDGSSWSKAFGCLQEAIDSARGGTEIWVSRGVYVPADPVGGTGARRAAFRMKNRVAIYGGFAGNETRLSARKIASNATILSGDLGIEKDESDDAYHVINNAGLMLDATAALDGFIIECGNADGAGIDAMGGGALCDGGSPTIVNCTFRKNLADIGGAIAADGAGPHLRNCTFEDNNARMGGAVRVIRSSPRFTHCTFVRNSADSAGGALFSDTGATLLVDSCTFKYDSAALGGALYLAGGSARLNQCALDTNAAMYGGAVMAAGEGSYELSSCTLRGNAARAGGAIDAASGAWVSCMRITFEGNVADSLGGAIRIVGDQAAGGMTGGFAGDSCRFVKNRAIAGGALYADSTSVVTLAMIYAERNSASSGGALYIMGNANLENARFFTNEAVEGSGGAVCISGREIDISDAQFSGNSAGRNGGALHIAKAVRCTVQNATFLRNGASNGGGLSLAPASAGDTAVFSDILFIENSAVVYGGGAHTASYILFDTCGFGKNSASMGGGHYSADVCPSLRKCTFSANVADLDGGGSYTEGCSPTADDATVYESNTPNDTN